MALAPGSPTSYNIAPGQSQADLDIKKKMALSLMQQGADASPVQHWTQGLARVAQGLIGGYGMGEAAREDEADRDKARSIMQALSGGGTGTATMPTPAPASAPIDPTAPRTASVPRGIRNNNPLNIEAGPFTSGQPGFSGSDGRFARFEQPQQGVDAAGKLLDTYGSKYGLNTVGGIVNRWAPPSDNNPSQAYAASVAGRMGVGVDDKIDLTNPDTKTKIIQAMGQFENGRPISAAQPAQPGMAPVGAPVDQPRGGLGDDRRSQLIAALSQTRAGAPMAQALFAKELDREATRSRPLTEDEKKIYPGAVAIKAGGEPIFPPPSTNVQLSTVANPVLEGVGKQIVDQRKNAQVAAQTTIPVIHDARKFLDEGALTGTTSGIQLAIKKVGSAFGIPDDKIANTEAFRSAIGNEVLAHIKALGANPSNADRDYIEKVQGGQINLDEPSLRKILDMTEKYSRNTIRNFNADSKKLMAASPDGTYKQIAPLMGFDEPPAYVPPEKPAAPAVAPAPAAGQPTVAPKIRKFNPATGKIE